MQKTPSSEHQQNTKKKVKEGKNGITIHKNRAHQTFQKMNSSLK